MTFLLGEDQALKLRLQGMTVTDQKATGDNFNRQVAVWFGFPDQEIRAQSYPYVTIEMIDIQHDAGREMRGTTDADYLIPADVTVSSDTTYVLDYPIPVNIDYQVTTYSRNPLHDRQIVQQLLFKKLPHRFGYLEIPEKSVTVGSTTTNTITVRRMDVMDVSKRDIVEQGKRLYQNVVTVRVSSEVSNHEFEATTSYKVQTINLTTHADEHIFTSGVLSATVISPFTNLVFANDPSPLPINGMRVSWAGKASGGIPITVVTYSPATKTAIVSSSVGAITSGTAIRFTTSTYTRFPLHNQSPF